MYLLFKKNVANVLQDRNKDVKDETVSWTFNRHTSQQVPLKFKICCHLQAAFVYCFWEF